MDALLDKRSDNIFLAFQLTINDAGFKGIELKIAII